MSFDFREVGTLLLSIINLSARHGVTPVEVRIVQQGSMFRVSTYVVEIRYRMRLVPKTESVDLTLALRHAHDLTEKALDDRYSTGAQS